MLKIGHIILELASLLEKTDVGTTLCFSGHKVREYVTGLLDLWHAISITFVLRIDCSNGRCENANVAENVELQSRS